MGHKITLTGYPISKLREHQEYLAFDMKETGSVNAPKGLPPSGTIRYTVFLNKKQLKKAELEGKNIQEHKVMIQGEPTFDITKDLCWGEIGVICFQISLIPEKKIESSEGAHKNNQEKQDLKKAPKGTVEFISLSDIVVPEDFLKTTPNEEKTEQVIKYAQENGHLDKPITLHKETKTLVDEYRRYIVAKRLNMDLVPIKYL